MKQQLEDLSTSGEGISTQSDDIKGKKEENNENNQKKEDISINNKSSENKLLDSVILEQEKNDLSKTFAEEDNLKSSICSSDKSIEDDYSVSTEEVRINYNLLHFLCLCKLFFISFL